MTVGMVADESAFETVVERVVDVDGIPMSLLCAEAREPRAVVVAVHGAATTARYFDFPGRPQLSLLRTGALLGYTVLALDRPGYGASNSHAAVFDSPQHRVAACYDLIDAALGSRPRGAGVFLMAHSAGCDLAVRMAAAERGRELLGLELAGTGLHKHAEAIRRLGEVHRTGSAAAIGELLWYPKDSYPPEIVGGRLIAFQRTPRYETSVERHWPDDFRSLAGDVQVPVRFSHAEHEPVWQSDPAALGEIRELFRAAPRFDTQRQPGSGHNLSVGYAAAAYHLNVLSFAEQCIVQAANPTPR